ncbi:hypothetical protein [Streptomyces cellulosae]|nr:hypothetical protein [Streptomyces cellulosae]
MNRILDIDEVAGIARGEAGVVLDTLQGATALHGLALPRSVLAQPLPARRDDRQRRVREPFPSARADRLPHRGAGDRDGRRQGQEEWARTAPRVRSEILRRAYENAQYLVFSPVTLKRLVEEGSLTNVGAEMDPSHLMDTVGESWAERDVGPHDPLWS